MLLPLPFLLSFAWFVTSPFGKAVEKPKRDYVNSPDADFPWYFSGRAVMRPAIVKLDKSRIPKDTTVLSLLGWTIGGSVALEYDESPVGPYREFVCLGGLALSQNNGKLLLGQYGSRLFVNAKQAEQLCQDVWDLYAESSAIEFVSKQERLSLPVVVPNDQPESIVVDGWSQLQKGEQETKRNFNGFPLLWTPAIKAIWTQLFWGKDSSEAPPLHRLRLSGTGKLSFHAFDGLTEDGIPLGFDIMVQNLLIEISPSLSTK